MSPYFSILATLLQNIAAVARNPVINANASEGSTVSRVGELIDVAAGLVLQGASAITELEKFNAQVLEIKTSGRALEQADFDRLKALSDSYQRRRDALKAQGVDLDAENGFVAPAVSSTVDSPSGNSDQNDRLARRPMNPTVPGAKEVIARKQGGTATTVQAESKPVAAAPKPVAAAAAPTVAPASSTAPAGSEAAAPDAVTASADVSGGVEEDRAST